MSAQPRYPVYVISKGRADCCLTAHALRAEDIAFKIVVEPHEAEDYGLVFGHTRLLVLPQDNPDKGTMVPRNFVLDHARESGALRHWTLDDNISAMYRRVAARREKCEWGFALATMEDFVDRYENVAIASPRNSKFVFDKGYHPPFLVNHNVYCCMLVSSDLPFRYRGEHGGTDVDFTLQVLTSGLGLCTIAFNAFLSYKDKPVQMKGGNKSIYKGDGLLKRARFLERQWPGLFRQKRRFGRPHFAIAGWGKFDTPLRLKAEYCA